MWVPHLEMMNRYCPFTGCQRIIRFTDKSHLLLSLLEQFVHVDGFMYFVIVFVIKQLSEFAILSTVYSFIHSLIQCISKFPSREKIFDR